MSEFAVSGEIPVDLMAQIDSANNAGLTELLQHVFHACRLIGTSLRNLGMSSDKVGTTNSFGDSQLDVDIKTDEIMFSCLKASNLVHVAASEENPIEIDCSNENINIIGGGYSVAFDPLDGSSIVDANFAVGTILGIWPGKGLLNRFGREQCASLVCMYGPRVTIALALNTNATINKTAISIELTMAQSGWIITRNIFKIAPIAKTFAPGNLRATSDNPKYKQLVDYWVNNKFTLRYSGGLVPDVYHILIKGEGVLANASSPTAKAKLRLLFEAAPIALIIESAGGKSVVCASEANEPIEPVSLLDVPISDLDKRVGVCYGSQAECDRFISVLF